MVGKIFKWLFIAIFAGAIGYGLYLSAQQLLYKGQIKVLITNKDTGEPVGNKEIIFEEICSDDTECNTKELFRHTTSRSGVFYADSKPIRESFNVVAEGFEVDGPWLKRPGSLLYTRQHSVEDVYQVDLSGGELKIKLTPLKQ